MKQLAIYFIAVFIFIAAVGFYTRGNYNKNSIGAILAPEPAKEIVVGGHTIPVEVANSEVERSKGLGGKEFLKGGEGMLFIFEKTGVMPPFWMKDMNFAIDIIWINDGRVAQITKEIPPPKEGSYNSELELYLPNSAIDYVLEVNAGYAKEIGLKVSDTVDLSKAL